MLAEIAENQDYERLFQAKFDLTLEVQAYFLDSLDASAMKTIKELVRVFCSNYGKVPRGHMPINAILPCDPLDYLEPSSEKNKAMIIKVFADDRAYLLEDLKDVRKLPCPV